MFTGILYTHIFYALGGSEMPNGQNLRPIAVIDRLSTVKKGYWPPLSIIGHVTYAPLSGVYECPLCSHGPRGPVGV